MNISIQRWLIVLLLVNIGLTVAVLVRQQPGISADGKAAAESLPEEVVVPFGQRVVAAFNSGDAEQLYRLYHEDARAKLTQGEVADQLERLRSLFGQVERMSYLNNLRLGEQNGEEYFQAHFAVRVAKAELKKAQLVLHLIREDGEVFLYGMRLNAAQP